METIGILIFLCTDFYLLQFSCSASTTLEMTSASVSSTWICLLSAGRTQDPWWAHKCFAFGLPFNGFSALNFVLFFWWWWWSCNPLQGFTLIIFMGNHRTLIFGIELKISSFRPSLKMWSNLTLVFHKVELNQFYIWSCQSHRVWARIWWSN